MTLDVPVNSRKKGGFTEVGGTRRGNKEEWGLKVRSSSDQVWGLIVLVVTEEV